MTKNHFFDPIATWFGVGGRGFQMDPRVIWAGRSGRSSQICDIWVLELNLRPLPNSRSYLTPKRPKNRFCRHLRAWVTLPPQPKKPRYPHGPLFYLKPIYQMRSTLRNVKPESKELTAHHRSPSDWADRKNCYCSMHACLQLGNF